MSEADAFLDEALGIWGACPAALPALEREYSEAEQRARESRLEQFLHALQKEMQTPPHSRAERLAAHDRITGAFAEFATAALGLDGAHLDLLLNDGFSSIATRLAREARRFDPAVRTADILQASRNAWTACGLQLLFGREMALTPSIFAYSMLYPYSDNYLDDPEVTREAKRGFGERFGRRLSGDSVGAANAQEEILWRLVAMVESEYPRERHPQIFDSLLAIHRAQMDSVRLLRGRPPEEGVDVARLVFAKGGSSVLADAMLAAGSPSPEQARFAFYWGVLLQLGDDLQDVREDMRDGVLTLFSQSAARGPLDALMCRTLRFAGHVMSLLRQLPGGEVPALRQLIERSSLSLLIRASGDAGELHSPALLELLEKHSPFRFAVLNAHRQRLASRAGMMAKLFEAFLAGDADEPAFPWLPTSLMPRV